MITYKTVASKRFTGRQITKTVQFSPHQWQLIRGQLSPGEISDVSVPPPRLGHRLSPSISVTFRTLTTAKKFRELVKAMS